MRGFITIPTEAGEAILGVAQIASIEAGGKRGQNANIRLGNGAQFEAFASIDAVLELIEAATEEPEPIMSPEERAHIVAPVERSGAAVDMSKVGHPDGQKMVEAYSDNSKVEVVKRRGRPPKGSS